MFTGRQTCSPSTNKHALGLLVSSLDPSRVAAIPTCACKASAQVRRDALQRHVDGHKGAKEGGHRALVLEPRPVEHQLDVHAPMRRGGVMQLDAFKGVHMQ